MNAFARPHLPELRQRRLVLLLEAALAALQPHRHLLNVMRMLKMMMLVVVLKPYCQLMMLILKILLMKENSSK
jgi:hypothetical protein